MFSAFYVLHPGGSGGWLCRSCRYRCFRVGFLITHCPSLRALLFGLFHAVDVSFVYGPGSLTCSRVWARHGRIGGGGLEWWVALPSASVKIRRLLSRSLIPALFLPTYLHLPPFSIQCFLPHIRNLYQGAAGWGRDAFRFWLSSWLSMSLRSHTVSGDAAFRVRDRRRRGWTRVAASCQLVKWLLARGGVRIGIDDFMSFTGCGGGMPTVTRLEVSTVLLPVIGESAFTMRTDVLSDVKSISLTILLWRRPLQGVSLVLITDRW